MMTANKLKELVESCLENESEPAGMLAWAERMAGRKLTKAMIPADYVISKNYGMTQLVRIVQQPAEQERYSFLLRHHTVNVLVPDVETFKELNSQYYRGLQERNGYRRELLDDGRLLLLTKAMNDYIDGWVRLERVKDKFNEYTAYPFPDNSMLKRAIKDEVERVLGRGVKHE